MAVTDEHAGIPAGAGVWLYPWDLLDLGAERVAGLLAGMGLTEAYVTASYHTVHVLSRVNPSRRMVLAPRPALYFRHDESLWGSLTPYRSPLVDEIGDALGAARAPFADAGVGLVAWAVCLHGPALAATGRSARVVSPLGGRVETAPCVRDPHVRAFTRALVRDAGGRGDRVQLEAAHWVPGPHHQHAKFDTGEPALAGLLTAWCVCDRCLLAVADAGADPARLVGDLGRAAALVLEERSPSAALDRERAIALLRSEVTGLDVFLAARCAAVTALARELADACPVPVEFVALGDPLLTGIDADALDAAGVPVRMLAYGPPETVAERARQVGRGVVRRGGIGLSLLAGDTDDEDALGGSVAAAAGAGFTNIGFYNFGLVGEARHRWVRPALEAAGAAMTGTA